MIKPITKRIVSSTTTTPISESCSLKQLVISCANAGTAWSLKIQDKASPASILIPAFTLTVPTNGIPNVNLTWNDLPLPMEGGIDIITSGTPGEVAVWLHIQKVGAT